MGGRSAPGTVSCARRGEDRKEKKKSPRRGVAPAPPLPPPPPSLPPPQSLLPPELALAAASSALRRTLRGGLETYQAHQPGGGGRTLTACPLQAFPLAQPADLSSDWRANQSNSSPRPCAVPRGPGGRGEGRLTCVSAPPAALFPPLASGHLRPRWARTRSTQVWPFIRQVRSGEARPRAVEEAGVSLFEPPRAGGRLVVADRLVQSNCSPPRLGGMCPPFLKASVLPRPP